MASCECHCPDMEKFSYDLRQRIGAAPPAQAASAATRMWPRLRPARARTRAWPSWTCAPRRPTRPSQAAWSMARAGSAARRPSCRARPTPPRSRVRAQTLHHHLRARGHMLWSTCSLLPVGNVLRACAQPSLVWRPHGGMPMGPGQGAVQPSHTQRTSRKQNTQPVHTLHACASRPGQTWPEPWRQARTTASW